MVGPAEATSTGTGPDPGSSGRPAPRDTPNLGLSGVVAVVAALIAAINTTIGGQDPYVTAGLAVLAALATMVTVDRASKVDVGEPRPASVVAECLLRADDIDDIEAAVAAEFSVWGFEPVWFRVVPLISTRAPDHTDQAPIARDLTRILTKIGTSADPINVPVRTGEGFAVRCPGSSYVLVVVAEEPYDAATEASIIDLAVLIGFASRQTEVDAELDAKRSSARFEELVRFSSDAIFIVDPAGKIHYAAPSVTTVLGHPSSDLIGCSLADLIAEAPQVSDLRTLLATVERHPPRHPVSIELGLIRADGIRIEGELTGSNLLSNTDVRGIVVTVRDVTTRKDLEEQLRHQAFHDALTGLANRALFHDRLDRAMKVRRDPASTSPAVAYLDLDDFKNVNDTLGHDAGDELLKVVAERIQRDLRGSDTAARLGGDEFALIFEEAPEADVLVELVQRIVDSVGAPIMLGSDRIIEVRVSAGLATCADGVSTTADLLRHADIAMYRAKSQGKAQVVEYKPEMHRAVADRLTLTADLDAAVHDDQLEVHYQPILDLVTEQVVAVEALARWPHQTRGILTPAAFIALAEETGLIVPLGRSILRQATEALATWHAEGFDLDLSVNISSRQFHDPGFEDDLYAICEASGVEPSSIIVEITESTIARDREGALARAKALTSHGVRLAVDDFGIGQSSIHSLRELPFHHLKIDRALVEPIGDRTESALVGTIVELAHSLGAAAVAEGIEQSSELASLRRLGCAFGQGNYFGPPRPAADVPEMLVASPLRSASLLS